MSSLPRYAVIGDPVEHSLSPRLFAALFNDLGLSAQYVAERVTAENLAPFLARMREGSFAGISVTLPHKVAIFDLLDEISPGARLLGAVNCVARSEDGRLHGFNTDAPGLVAALARTGWDFASRPAFVLGAGGAARASVLALLQRGTRKLTLANRTPANVYGLTDALKGPLQAIDFRVAKLGELTRLPDDAIVINATRVGLGQPGEDPLPAQVALGPGHGVVDLVYRPLETALLRRARLTGAQTLDGLWMLVYQALDQLQHWTGTDVSPAEAERLHALLAPEAR